MARVKKDGKYGFLDSTGVLTIRLLYDRATDFTWTYDHTSDTPTAIANVVLAKKRLRIRPDGKTLNAPRTIPPEYKPDEIEFTETDQVGIRPLPNGQQEVYQLADGKRLSVFKAVQIRAFSDGTGQDYYTIVAQTPTGWELYDGHWKRLSPNQFLFVDASPLATIVNLNGRFGALDTRRGTSLLPCSFDSLRYLYCGGDCYSFLAKTNGKWGAMNGDRQWIVEAIYDGIAMPSVPGYPEYIVRKGKKYGFISPEGIITAIYDSLEQATDGLLKVRLGGNIGYIDRLGTHYFED